MPSLFRVSLVNFHCRAPSTQDQNVGGGVAAWTPQKLRGVSHSVGSSQVTDKTDKWMSEGGLGGRAKPSERTGAHALQPSWIVLRSTGAPFRQRGRAIQELTETHSPALFEIAGKSDW